MTAAGEENFFRSKYTTTVAFAVALLLFLLPFVEFRCNGVTVAQNTGIGLAFGNDYQLGSDLESMRKSLNDERELKKEGPASDSGKVYVFAIIALLLGITGMALSLTGIRKGIVNTLTGVLAALSLLALMLQVNSDFDEQAASGRNEVSESVKVSIAFTIWYYLSLVCFLAAAFFSFKRGQLLARNEAPANAPQLDLDNPGEQSDFPKSASESEIG